MQAQWDFFSLFVYISVGIIGQLCFFYYQRITRYDICHFVPIKQKMNKRTRIPLIVLFISWEIFACFRYVAPGIGGADAYPYITYFQECLDPNTTNGYATHAEILYRYLNMIIRLFTSEYRVFFFIVYGFILFACIKFYKQFSVRNMSTVPIVLLVFFYIRGFASLRSILAAVVLLLGLCLLYRNKNILAILSIISSILIHKSMFFYSLFIVFYWLYKKNRITIKSIIIWIVLSTIAARIVQDIMATSQFSFLSTGSYVFFSQQNRGISFFQDGWKIAFSQLLLGLSILLLNKRIDIRIASGDEDSKRIKYLRLICYYDLMMIPVNFVLNIWRGYENFYLPRLMMWGIIIEFTKKRFNGRGRSLISTLYWFAMLAWMTFRFYNTYEDSCIMPYIFEPLFVLFR